MENQKTGIKIFFHDNFPPFYGRFKSKAFSDFSTIWTMCDHCAQHQGTNSIFVNCEMNMWKAEKIQINKLMPLWLVEWESSI